MTSNTIRTLLYTACAVAPVAYVLAGEDSVLRQSPTPAQIIPAAGGAGPNYFPDVTVTTHEGEKVHFYNDLLQDKVVVINFMYARCVGICPGTTANLLKVQRRLGDLVGRDIFMYSITLKPEEDTPEVLRTYAAAHGVQPGWKFLTGAPDDIEQIRQALGFTDPDPLVDADKSSHVGMILYGNVAHQQWAACPCLSDSELIVEQIMWMLPKDKHPAPKPTAAVSQSG